MIKRSRFTTLPSIARWHEVKIGDEATVRIPLVPDDKPVAEPEEIVL